MTVRHALEELKREGLLEGRRGAGMRVGPGACRQRFGAAEDLRGGRPTLRSFTEIFRAQGRQVGGRVLSRGRVKAPEAAARELRLEPEALALEIRRLRLLDGEPVSLETSYYPLGPAADRLLETDLTDRSVYEILGQAGTVPEEAVETLELGVAGRYEAEALGAPPGIPVVLARRTTFDAGGRPVEFTRVVYRGDKQTFTARLRRDELGPAAVPSSEEAGRPKKRRR